MTVKHGDMYHQLAMMYGRRGGCACCIIHIYGPGYIQMKTYTARIKSLLLPNGKHYQASEGYH